MSGKVAQYLTAQQLSSKDYQQMTTREFYVDLPLDKLDSGKCSEFDVWGNKFILAVFVEEQTAVVSVNVCLDDELKPLPSRWKLELLDTMNQPLITQGSDKFVVDEERAYGQILMSLQQMANPMNRFIEAGMLRIKATFEKPQALRSKPKLSEEHKMQRLGNCFGQLLNSGLMRYLLAMSVCV